VKTILILGGSGMLGHQAYQRFKKHFTTRVTFRRFDDKLQQTHRFDKRDVIEGVDGFDIVSVQRAIDEVKPDVVLNCVGIIKQLKEAYNPKISIYINALFPHLVAERCKENGARLIHISTDCVFTGSKGDYTESDKSDAEDLYGKTKFLGETNYDTGGALTLRTSIVGHELFTNVSLVDWFLSQNGKRVNGYTRAIYTGLTNLALADEIIRVINDFPTLAGLYHVSAEKINKYDLLMLIKKIYNLNIEVTPFADFFCDRSLDSSRYRAATGFVPPTWEQMITEMHLSKTRGE
jgi:dTDP-4-dehydrorhamnose reductase